MPLKIEDIVESLHKITAELNDASDCDGLEDLLAVIQDAEAEVEALIEGYEE